MTYEDVLEQIASENDRLIVMTAENRAAIRNLPGKIGPRFIDVGICEQTMIGAAAGLALRGRIPVTHALASFLTLRAFEFIRTDVGISGLPVKLVGGVPGFLSDANGPTHQAIEDISIMRGIPGMCIYSPADAEDMVIGLRQVIESDSPFYIRHNATPAIVEHDRTFQIGKAEIFGDGTDVTLIVHGFLFREAYRAKELLEAEGRSVRLLNLRTVKPIDRAAIIDAARQTGLLVTIEDHFITGGLYSILGEIFLEEGISAKVLPLALKDRWFTPALLPDVLETEGFTAQRIADQVTARLESR